VETSSLWFDADAIDAWNAPSGGRPGGHHRYSDLAFACALTLRAVFHLPLRQTEGFVRSLIHLMGLDLDTPDPTTLLRVAYLAWRERKRITRSHVAFLVPTTGAGLRVDPL
jgi:hypothetical protein